MSTGSLGIRKNVTVSDIGSWCRQRDTVDESEEPGFPVSIVCLLLFYTIATVLQLYHCGDMMCEMRKNPEPTLLPTQEIFNLPHNIVMVCEEPTFDDSVSYTQWGNVLQPI